MALEMEAHELPQVLSFGSWIGGDRDGNPFVTPEVTRDAIQLARGHLLLYYQRQLDELIDLVTTSAQQIGVSDELLQRLEAYVALVHTPEAQVFGAQYEFEYYRRFAICLKARIQRTLESRGAAGARRALPVMPYTLCARTGQAGAGAARLLLGAGFPRRSGDAARVAGRAIAGCALRGRWWIR